MKIKKSRIQSDDTINTGYNLVSTEICLWSFLSQVTNPLQLSGNSVNGLSKRVIGIELKCMHLPTPIHSYSLLPPEELEQTTYAPAAAPPISCCFTFGGMVMSMSRTLSSTYLMAPFLFVS